MQFCVVLMLHVRGCSLRPTFRISGSHLDTPAKLITIYLRKYVARARDNTYECNFLGNGVVVIVVAVVVIAVTLTPGRLFARRNEDKGIPCSSGEIGERRKSTCMRNARFVCSPMYIHTHTSPRKYVASPTSVHYGYLRACISAG